MLTLLVTWLVTGLGLVLLASRGRGSAGLPLAYYIGISLIHVPGAVLYYGEELSTFGRWTVEGFELTIIGLIAFLAGIVIASFGYREHYPNREAKAANFSQTQDRFSNQSRALNLLTLQYLGIGAAAYFLILPFAGSIPSAAAIVSALGSFLIVGICLRLWHAKCTGNSFRLWAAIALIPALPLATLIKGGFLGFGTFWAIAIMTFLFAQSTRKILYLLVTPIAFFVALSVFVNYMVARSEIRQLIWFEQAGISDRIQRIATMVQEFEWLDPTDARHRKAVDDRLNQNFLVGLAAERLQADVVQYSRGETIGHIVLALIPRAIWPDKPQIGGGGTIVQDFTGLEFAEGTSVGAGQVFEFYVNFGTSGVICGFLLYGWLLARIDQRAIQYLRSGDQRSFLFWFMIGLALLQPGGNLREVIVSVASSAFAAYGAAYFLIRPPSQSPVSPIRSVKLGHE